MFFTGVRDSKPKFNIIPSLTTQFIHLVALTEYVSLKGYLKWSGDFMKSQEPNFVLIETIFITLRLSDDDRRKSGHKI